MVFSVFVAEPSNVFNRENPEINGQLLGTIPSKTRFTWIEYEEQDIDVQAKQFIDNHRTKIKHKAAAQFAEVIPVGCRMVLCGHGAAKTEQFFIELNASNTEAAP